jgi:CrcB protein
MPPDPTPHPLDARPPLLHEWSAVAVGGVIGASLRHGIGLAAAKLAALSILGTLISNVVGALLLGAVLGHLSRGPSHRLLRPFLVVGVFGSFTTFSTLALETRGLAIDARAPVAALYLIGSIAAGLLAFVVGQWLARGSR